MFTGIIRQIGTVLSVSPTPAGRRLVIALGILRDRLSAGDSVAVNGACLTAAELLPDGSAAFDAVAETLERTTLGDLAARGRVNLERALRLGEGLDGHLVQGHVDAVASVRRVDRAAGQCRITFAADAELTGQMVPKGSVAVDGVSLTLTDVQRDSFGVAVIPTTLAETTLGDARAGQRVNVEVDLIGKYVRRYLSAMAPDAAGGLTMDKLRDAGFA